jgi:hypothetical protein
MKWDKGSLLESLHRRSSNEWMAPEGGKAKKIVHDGPRDPSAAAMYCEDLSATIVVGMYGGACCDLVSKLRVVYARASTDVCVMP